LGFLNAKGDRVKLLEHPNMEIERVLRCTGCRMDIAVGPCFEHIDPATYVGVVCGCAEVELLPSPAGTVEGAGRLGPTPDEAKNG